MRDFKIENLVLDAAPLLSTAASSSASALRGLADNFTTTPDVVAEIRDKTSRELFNSTLQVLGLESATDLKQTGGLQVRTPSADSVARIIAFARLTGDISVLSEADIRVLALTYALEVEQNGLRRIRPAPGKLSPLEQEREDKKKERLERLEAEKKSQENEVQLENLSLQESDEVQPPKASTSSLPPPSQEESSSGRSNNKEKEASEQVDEKDEYEDTPPTINAQDASAEEDVESDGDGTWITPENVTLHKSRDLGLFPSLPARHPGAVVSKRKKAAKQMTVLKVACLTGDYAMQNVALQMGLNVFGVGGQKIKEVKTWVLRCHACFKLCKDPERKFCPSCGNPSLIRASITYVTPSPENPKGYILHLKSNFQYKLRGTQYSIPNPKQGSSHALKNNKNAEIILREDQKEYQRGLRSADYLKKKQERAAVKAVRDGKSGGASSIFGGWDDPDWTPEMLMGSNGRKGAPPGVRIGKDGLPVIGHGRRNPNEVRKPRK